MRVLLLNQFFYPDFSATAQLATDLAEDLALAGAEVTALAASGSYLGREKLAPREEHRGVRIERVPCTSLGKGTLAHRAVDYASFYTSAALRVANRARPDVVIAMSTPPLIASLGAVLGATGSKFVYWVQDLYPEVAVKLGVLRQGSLSTRVLGQLSRAVVTRSHAVVVLGGEMAERLAAKGAPRDRIHVIPNWADGDSIRPVAHEENAFRREHGFSGRRVALYSGNMGLGHDLRTLLEAARALEHDGIEFLFIGDGAKRREVEEAARHCASIRILPYQARGRLSESLSSGDVHLISQEPTTLGLIEPSKLYGILAAGRPVIYVGPNGSEVACTIEREGVGRVVANGDVAGAVTAIRDLLSASHALGERARAAFERRYERRLRTAEFLRVLQGLTRSDPTREASRGSL